MQAAAQVLIMRRMAYMLMILEDPDQRSTRTQSEGEAVYQRMVDFASKLKREGKLRAVESLVHQREGRRVAVRSGKAQVLDGPFAEAKEMIGGFFVVEVETREEAEAIARECPAAEWATIEVRETGPCYL